MAAALAKAQASMGNVERTAQGAHHKYPELGDVCDAVRSHLTENEIATYQAVTSAGPIVAITTLLAHASGEFFESDTVLTVAKPAVWEQCGGFTYGRRYSLLAAVGLAPEDDDGQAAQGDDRPAQASQPRKAHAAPEPQQSRGQGGNTISSKQASRLWAIAHENDAANDVRAWLRRKNYEHPTEIPWREYDGIIERIKAGTLLGEVPSQHDDLVPVADLAEQAQQHLDDSVIPEDFR